VERYYLPLSLLVLITSMVPFYRRFEKKKMTAEEIVFIASVSAIGAVGRVPFAALPGVQPTSFIVIMSGLTLGPQAGFIIGSTSAIVSNLFLGQGPWTPWQMMAWGLMGLTAGLFRHTSINKQTWFLAFFGFVWGFFHGWIMNLWFVIGFFNPLTWQVWLGAFAASFYFDLSHALTNATLLFLFSRRWKKIMGRMVSKFGLLK